MQKDNFSSGTSSRSTELIHRGVRYLQKAIMKLDYKQSDVSECVGVACFLSLCCQLQQFITYTNDVGQRCRRDDLESLLAESKITGQHDDARMNLAIALTAARYVAAIANYTEVVHLLERADPSDGGERGSTESTAGM